MTASAKPRGQKSGVALHALDYAHTKKVPKVAHPRAKLIFKIAEFANFIR